MSVAAQRERAAAVGAEVVSRSAAQPAWREDARRPSLEVVANRRRRTRRRFLAPLLSAAAVSGSLLLVVIGHAELAQGQVRLASVQAAITSAQLLHAHQVLAVARLENPARILGEAEGSLHMASPSQLHQLAHVPLGVQLPAPHVAASTGGTAAPETASSG
ncbi:MAG: hypothetical protein ACRDXC_00570 [Acidimicrobiales bacterium]